MGSVKTISSGAFANNFSLGNVIIPQSVSVIGNSAFNSSGANILILNKNVSVGANAFSDTTYSICRGKYEELYGRRYSNGPSTVYGYADSSWWSDGSGNKIALIEELSAEDMVLIIGNSKEQTIFSDQPDSEQYIPSSTYVSEDSSIATLSLDQTGKGVMKNTVNGLNVGNTNVTVNAIQVGADVFGVSAVPAIPAATFKVTIYPETTSITIRKVWQDYENADGYRPSSVTILLLENDEPTEYCHELSGEGNIWEYTFEAVPFSEHYTILETTAICN